jgi:hypothetical protein
MLPLLLYALSECLNKKDLGATLFKEATSITHHGLNAGRTRSLPVPFEIFGSAGASSPGINIGPAAL